MDRIKEIRIFHKDCKISECKYAFLLSVIEEKDRVIKKQGDVIHDLEGISTMATERAEQAEARVAELEKWITTPVSYAESLKDQIKRHPSISTLREGLEFINKLSKDTLNYSLDIAEISEQLLKLMEEVSDDRKMDTQNQESPYE